MSEYQYYEFRAVDQPLSAERCKRLRQISLRGRISSRGFLNEGQWGEFKGEPQTGRRPLVRTPTV